MYLSLKNVPLNLTTELPDKVWDFAAVNKEDSEVIVLASLPQILSLFRKMPSKSSVGVSFRITVDSRLLGMLYTQFQITSEVTSENVCRLTSRRNFGK